MSSSIVDPVFEPYVMAITEQIEQHKCGLDELSEILRHRPLTFNERSATERSIQVMVEAAIGSSKQYLKAKGVPVPAEARASVERVYERLSIVEPNLSDMRGAIGMRNAIIHDYLNLDWQLLEKILSEKKYQLVILYVQKISAELLKM